MDDDERRTMVESLKWVDEVLTGERGPHFTARAALALTLALNRRSVGQYPGSAPNPARSSEGWPRLPAPLSAGTARWWPSGRPARSTPQPGLPLALTQTPPSHPIPIPPPPPDVPYELTPDFLKVLFTKHRIDVVVHGDDPCLLPDGTDA